MPEYKLKTIHNPRKREIIFYDKRKIIAKRNYTTENMSDMRGPNWFEDSMLGDLVEAQIRIFRKNPERTRIKMTIW